MGIRIDRKTNRGKLRLFFVALCVLPGCQSGFAEDQDIEQLRQAAKQGNVEAQLSLGQSYATGRGVPKDDGEAVKYFRLAAEQGHAQAQFSLGYAYAMGDGVPQDFVKAYAWANLATAQGHKEAVKGRDQLAARMTADQLAEAQKLAAWLWQRIESSRPD